MAPREAHFEIFPDAEGERRWRAQAANGISTGHSDQPFRDDTDAERAILDHVRTVALAIGAPEIADLDDQSLRRRTSIERVEA